MAYGLKASSCHPLILTVHDVTKTNLLALDSIVHRYVKSWSGLARSAAPEIIHIPHLLDIKSIYQLYLECHVGAHLSTRSKVDPKLILLSTPVLRGIVNGQRSVLFLHTVKIRSTGLIILGHLRKRKLC